LADDNLPEEDDAFVGILRQAYAGTPVPDTLIPRVAAAVHRAEVATVEQPTVRRSRLSLGRLALGPVLAAALVVAGIAFMNGFDQKQPAAAPASRVLWTNQPAAGIQADAAYIPPDLIRVSYRVPAARIAGRSAASAAGATFAAPIRTTAVVDLQVRAEFAPSSSFDFGKDIASVMTTKLAPTSCGSKPGVSETGHSAVRNGSERRTSAETASACFRAPKFETASHLRLLVVASVGIPINNGLDHPPTGHRAKDPSAPGPYKAAPAPATPSGVPKNCIGRDQKPCWLLSVRLSLLTHSPVDRGRHEPTTGRRK